MIRVSPVVEIADMSVRLSGLSGEAVERLWHPADKTVLYDRDSIMAFALGKPSEAFGDRYLPFRKQLVKRPRLPRLLKVSNRVVSPGRKVKPTVSMRSWMVTKTHLRSLDSVCTSKRWKRYCPE